MQARKLKEEEYGLGFEVWVGSDLTEDKGLLGMETVMKVELR